LVLRVRSSSFACAFTLGQIQLVPSPVVQHPRGLPPFPFFPPATLPAPPLQRSLLSSRRSFPAPIDACSLTPHKFLSSRTGAPSLNPSLRGTSPLATVRIVPCTLTEQCARGCPGRNRVLTRARFVFFRPFSIFVVLANLPKFFKTNPPLSVIVIAGNTLWFSSVCVPFCVFGFFCVSMWLWSVLNRVFSTLLLPRLFFCPCPVLPDRPLSFPVVRFQLSCDRFPFCCPVIAPPKARAIEHACSQGEALPPKTSCFLFWPARPPQTGSPVDGYWQFVLC